MTGTTAEELFGASVDEDPFGPVAVPAPAAAAKKKQTQPAIPTPQVRTFEAGPPVTLTFPYPISANRYWRPVPIGKHITIVPTKEAKQYRKDVAALCMVLGVRKPFPWRVTLEIRLYPNRPQDWAKRMKADPIAWDDTVQCLDLGNCEKVLSDAMNGVVFTDDKMIWRMVLDRMLPDEKGARVEVTVTPLQPIAPAGSLL